MQMTYPKSHHGDYLLKPSPALQSILDTLALTFPLSFTPVLGPPQHPLGTLPSSWPPPRHSPGLWKI